MIQRPGMPGPPRPAARRRAAAGAGMIASERRTGCRRPEAPGQWTRNYYSDHSISKTPARLPVFDIASMSPSAARVRTRAFRSSSVLRPRPAGPAGGPARSRPGAVNDRPALTPQQGSIGRDHLGLSRLRRALQPLSLANVTPGPSPRHAPVQPPPRDRPPA